MSKIKFTEALKIQDGFIFNPEGHALRMNRTMKHFFGKSFSLNDLTYSLANHPIHGFFKARIVYSETVESVEFLPYSFRNIQNLALVSNDRLHYNFKYADRGILDRLVNHCGCDDLIIVQNGFLTDSSFANLVFENDHGLFTPEKCLLAGTKRELLLADRQITPCPIKVEDLKSFKKVFLINSMIDLKDSISVDIANIIFPVLNL